MFKYIPVAAAGTLVLSGCSGGGAEEDIGANFQSRAEAAQQIYDQTSGMSATPEASMPQSATANYAGVASALATLPEGETEALYADVEMQADFASDTVSGDMTNWYGNTVGAIGGAVTLSDGAISGADWSASGAGTLSADGVTGDVAVSMNGTFLGPDASAMQGTFSGAVGYDGAPDGSIVGSIDVLLIP